MGNVLHKMLEIHATAPFQDASQFNEVWDQQISQQELRLRNSGLTAALVPLARTAPGYAVKKSVLRANLLQRTSTRTTEETGNRPPSSAPVSETNMLGTEKMLGTGRIKGKIDLARRNATGIEIVDYKSGRFMEAGSVATGEGFVKPEYADQLRMYAALFHEAHNVRPNQLLLVGLNGEEVPVPFTDGECDALLQEAYAFLDDIDQALKDGTGKAMARPGSAACRWCPYRPHCAPYLDLLDASGGCMGSDVTGVAANVVLRGNRLTGNMVTKEGLVAIQAVGAAATRLYDDLTRNAGAAVALFGMRSTLAGRTFTAEPTVVMSVLQEAQPVT